MIFSQSHIAHFFSKQASQFSKYWFTQFCFNRFIVFCFGDSFNMVTRGQRKKQGLQFRDDGRSVLSQIALIEEAARKGTEESLYTQRSIEETSNTTENSLETVVENNITEDVHIEKKSSNILRILRTGEIIDVGNVCDQKNNSDVDSNSESQDECDDRGVELTQITNAPGSSQGEHTVKEDIEELNVMLVRQCEPFVPSIPLLSQVKFENDIPFSQSTLKEAQNSIHPIRLEKENVINPYKKNKNFSKQTATSIKIPKTIEEIVHNMNQSFEEFGDDHEVIANCNRGGNTKKTEDRKVAVLKRMLDTMKEVKKPWVHSLLELVNCQYLQAKGDYISKDYALFDMLAGEKTLAKCALMNRILTLCFFKWKNAKNTGEETKSLQPSSFLKMIRTLLVKLRERNINFSHLEFNEIGEFSGVVASVWQNRQKEDSSYGCPKKKRVDHQFVRLLVEAIKKKTFQPMTNLKHMLFAVMFCNGYYCAFRGGEDHWGLKMEDVTEDVFSVEHGEEWEGLPFIRVNISASKATKLSLKYHSVKTNQRTSLIVPTELNVDGWNPPDIYKRYMSYCHPYAKTFYCKPIGSESMRYKVNMELKERDIEWNKKNPWNPRIPKDYDIRFFPSGNGVTNHNLGAKSLTNFCKDLGKLIGIKDFDSCTGHALRVLNCTNAQEGGLNCNDIANMACQSNIHVQKEYIHGMTATRERNQLNAITVGNVCARTSSGSKLLKNPPVTMAVPILPFKRNAEEQDNYETNQLECDENESKESLRWKIKYLEMELKLEKAKNLQSFHSSNGPWNIQEPYHGHSHGAWNHQPSTMYNHCPMTYHSYHHAPYRYGPPPPPPPPTTDYHGHHCGCNNYNCHHHGPWYGRYNGP